MYGCGVKCLEKIKGLTSVVHPMMFDLDFLTLRVEPPFPKGENRLIAVNIQGENLAKSCFHVGLAPENFGNKMNTRFGDYKSNIDVKVEFGNIYVRSGPSAEKCIKCDFQIPNGTNSINVMFAVYYKDDQNFCQVYLQDLKHRLPLTIIKLVRSMKMMIHSKTFNLTFSVSKFVDMPHKKFEDTDKIIVFNYRCVTRVRKAGSSSKAKKQSCKIEEITEDNSIDDCDDDSYVEENNEDSYVEENNEDTDASLFADDSDVEETMIVPVKTAERNPEGLEAKARPKQYVKISVRPKRNLKTKTPVDPVDDLSSALTHLKVQSTIENNIQFSKKKSKKAKNDESDDEYVLVKKQRKHK